MTGQALMTSDLDEYDVLLISMNWPKQTNAFSAILISTRSESRHSRATMSGRSLPSLEEDDS